MRSLAAVCVGLVIGAPAPAQGFPASQRAVVVQTVAFTDVTVRYGRPVARGRRLFGDSAIVKWESVWNPGADSATYLTISRDVLMEGHAVKAGEYSLWVVPRDNAPWTLVLSRAAHVFHTPYPGAQADELRLAVTVERGAHMETLAVYFPVVRDRKSVV